MKNKLPKILLISPWFEYMLGSEIHFYVIAKELKRLGYEVSVFTYLKETMWEMMRTLDVELLEDEIPDRFDIAICNGNAPFVKAPKSAFKIFISNGVIPENEYPIPGADAYVAVSEEVQSMMAQQGYSSTLIRNGVDMERFKSVKPINKKLKNILLLSNKWSPGTEPYQTLVDYCKFKGFNLNICGLVNGTAQWDIEEFINEADLVISMGRGIYESMACERNVLLAGYGNISGFVDNKNYKEYLKYNFSGRGSGKPFNVVDLDRELKKYNQAQGEKNRELVLKNHDIKITIQKFLKLYNG